MKKIARNVVTLMVVALVMLTMGCAGVQYSNDGGTRLKNGALLVQGGRTGVFGTDNSFVQIIPPAGEPAKVVTLKKTYRKSTSSWTGCSDLGWKPNKGAKNIKRSELYEEENQDVLAGGNEGQATFWAGGNSSTGNILAPAVAIAGGMVGAAAAHRPDSYNSSVTNTSQGGASTGGNTTLRSNIQGGNNVAQGGQGGQGGIGQGGQGGSGGQGGAGGSSASNSSNTNALTNTSNPTLTSTNTAQGDAAAAASSSSAAAAAAD